MIYLQVVGFLAGSALLGLTFGMVEEKWHARRQSLPGCKCFYCK